MINLAFLVVLASFGTEVADSAPAILAATTPTEPVSKRPCGTRGLLPKKRRQLVQADLGGERLLIRWVTSDIMQCWT